MSLDMGLANFAPIIAKPVARIGATVVDFGGNAPPSLRIIQPNPSEIRDLSGWCWNCSPPSRRPHVPLESHFARCRIDGWFPDLHYDLVWQAGICEARE